MTASIVCCPVLFVDEGYLTGQCEAFLLLAVILPLLPKYGHSEWKGRELTCPQWAVDGSPPSPCVSAAREAAISFIGDAFLLQCSVSQMSSIFKGCCKNLSHKRQLRWRIWPWRPPYLKPILSNGGIGVNATTLQYCTTASLSLSMAINAVRSFFLLEYDSC